MTDYDSDELFIDDNAPTRPQVIDIASNAAEVSTRKRKYTSIDDLYIESEDQPLAGWSDIKLNNHLRTVSTYFNEYEPSRKRLKVKATGEYVNSSETKELILRATNLKLIAKREARAEERRRNNEEMERRDRLRKKEAQDRREREYEQMNNNFEQSLKFYHLRDKFKTYYDVKLSDNGKTTIYLDVRMMIPDHYATVHKTTWLDYDIGLGFETDIEHDVRVPKDAYGQQSYIDDSATSLWIGPHTLSAGTTHRSGGIFKVVLEGEISEYMIYSCAGEVYFVRGIKIYKVVIPRKNITEYTLTQVACSVVKKHPVKITNDLNQTLIINTSDKNKIPIKIVHSDIDKTIDMRENCINQHGFSAIWRDWVLAPKYVGKDKIKYVWFNSVTRKNVYPDEGNAVGTYAVYLDEPVYDPVDMRRFNMYHDIDIIC